MTLIRLSLVMLIALQLMPAVARAQDTAGVGVIRGQVTTTDGDPAADVVICIASVSRCVTTDRRGDFQINDLRSAEYALEIVATSLPTLVATVTVRAGLDAVLEVQLPPATSVDEAITVTAPRFVTAEEVKTSAFLASGTDIAANAGALQDVTRFVQTLPGAVIGSDDFRNDLIVRGGSPLENLYVVDNIEIPNINTFATFASAGGTVSTIDAALIQDVTFLTGGFPAAYGNRASSVLQVALREGSRDQFGSRITFGFAGAGAVFEGPIAGRRGSFIVSGRRSVLDLVTADVGIGGVPVLYTANAKALIDLTPRDRVWMVNVTGFDRIRLGATEGSDPESELSNLDITYRGQRHATGFNWQRTFGNGGVGLLGATYARAAVRQRVGDLIRNAPISSAPLAEQLAQAAEVFRESSSESDFTLKYDLTAYAGVFGSVQAGAYGRSTTIDYDAASPYGNEGPFFVEAESNPFSLREQRTTRNAGGYAQLSRTLRGRFGITAGVRADRFGYLPTTRVGPRIGASLTITPAMALRFSAGRYYQQPFLVFVSTFKENRDLQPFHADHLVAGLGVTPDRSTRVTLEVYVKKYGRYPVSVDVPQLSLANVGDTFSIREVLFPMRSAGRGDASGVEFFAERKADAAARWHGQTNVAWSRTRYAGSDGVLRPGSFDYPIVANLTAAYRPGAKWDVSTRWSYLSGRPYTPIDVSRSTLARRAIYELDRVNGERAPAYFRIDLRVDRRFMVRGRQLAVFAGAQNLTNRTNVSGYTWDRRNGGIRTTEQLGLFPIAGFDWQF